MLLHAHFFPFTFRGFSRRFYPKRLTISTFVISLQVYLLLFLQVEEMFVLDEPDEEALSAVTDIPDVSGKLCSLWASLHFYILKCL